jgi:hypothetical protein
MGEAEFTAICTTAVGLVAFCLALYFWVKFGCQTELSRELQRSVNYWRDRCTKAENELRRERYKLARMSELLGTDDDE